LIELFVRSFMLSPATKLLDHVMSQALANDIVLDIYLHVQTNNLEAKGFYEKNGFEVVKVINDYYKKIEPSNCYLLVKSVHASN
jgi:N-alpha-acetyltransferase 50